jgi:hypothetical protein
MPDVVEINAATDTVVEREFTAAELEQHQKDVVEGEAAAIAEQEAAEELLEQRKAPLRRLGLTDEEIDAVLGL